MHEITGRYLNEDNLCCAFLQYHNTPFRRDNTAPVQKFFPAHRHSFTPEWQKLSEEIDLRNTNTLAQSKQYYDTHTHPLQEIQVGCPVALQNQQSKLWGIRM